MVDPSTGHSNITHGGECIDNPGANRTNRNMTETIVEIPDVRITYLVYY